MCNSLPFQLFSSTIFYQLTLVVYLVFLPLIRLIEGDGRCDIHYQCGTQHVILKPIYVKNNILKLYPVHFTYEKKGVCISQQNDSKMCAYNSLKTIPNYFK